MPLRLRCPGERALSLHAAGPVARSVQCPALTTAPQSWSLTGSTAPEVRVQRLRGGKMEMHGVAVVVWNRHNCSSGRHARGRTDTTKLCSQPNTIESMAVPVALVCSLVGAPRVEPRLHARPVHSVSLRKLGAEERFLPAGAAGVPPRVWRRTQRSTTQPAPRAPPIASPTTHPPGAPSFALSLGRGPFFSR